jgi:hypothetical protein
MLKSFDEIPIAQLLVFDGNELTFDGSDPSTYIVIEPLHGADEITAALGWSERDTNHGG